MTRNELVEQNLGLVHACAKRFAGKGIDYDDLYSAGVVGLIRAIDRFDPATGNKLSTYAVPVILGEIRMLFREGGTVKLSRSLQDLSRKAKMLTEKHLRETGCDLRITELAEKLGVDVYRAQEALEASRAPLSLSWENDGEEGAIDIPVPSQEEHITDRLSLYEAIGSLDEHEKKLIELRYYRHKTQTETAKELGTTQVQISRKEKKILMKMRMMLI